MKRELEGRARRLGDDINTDYIITSARKRETLDESVLKGYLLETVDPAFAASVQPGDIIVAGRNFGCGSAMEIAVTVILAAGIPAVIASSFSRAFYRNAINNGLLPIECDTSAISEGDQMSVRLHNGAAEVIQHSLERTLNAAPFPPLLLEIAEAGGLVPYLRRYGDFHAGSRSALDP
jgi:3-isopropylmalate/(R)-2-methylmalate dehydratase small subunit